MRLTFVLPLLALLAACAAAPEKQTPTAEDFPPTMRWDHTAQGADWTQASMAAMQRQGIPLVALIPGDIESWCPAYPEAGAEQRAAFWTGMFSALAKHESTWRPDAVGGGGKWYGLLQILPDTARRYGCKAGSGAALKNGEANLSCAIRIAARTVPRDGVVAANGRGLAADWGPFHSSRKREDMRAWVSQQSYCRK